ncbi:XdhC family protein [Deinococcus budaensis]|uniref:Xanthine/CO dehydrogenase XdhC/CoxF family maturation factor n=1 Tax=Deinococcus budaensis TaxID=1665626 RepID=A0A7W8GI39_9DEIO|nr:xanthine/CO dehydrogenase XdhC/CoxF family maturation factor [Deinococcus budaensis]
MNAAETRALLSALKTALSRGQGAALATVVGVRGSAYRREGTRMLVLEGGAQVCMLSGGCLEAEVVEVALEVLRSGQPALAHYDLSEDATWGLGIGCGGSVDVRVEAVDPGDPVTAGWLAALEGGRAAALAVPLVGEGRVLVGPDGTVTGRLPDPALHAFAVQAARERLALREPRAATLGAPGGTPVFVDVNVPPPELVLYGAGHDALPLAAQARALGYAVHVVDPRPAYLTPERFPGAALHPLAPEDLAHLTPGERAHLIVMNHHLDRDRLCLAHALRSAAGYVGVLGPRSRAEDLLRALAAAGEAFTPGQLARLRSPVGLRLGAEAPEEVALSILAELMAWRRGYGGGFLSGHAGRIHDAPTHAAAPRLPAAP